MNHVSHAVELILLPMSALPGTVNAYLIRGPKGFALVDCGLRDASSRRDLEQALCDRGLCFLDIETVFLTHHHVDHAGLARFLQQKGAKIYMSSADAKLLSDFYEYPERDEERAMFSGRHELPLKFVKSVKSTFSFLRKLGENFDPDATVEGNNVLSLAGLSFEVFSCPGHTPGHLCLVNRDLKIAFTGDCVISPRATHISALPTEQNADPFLDFILSLRRLSTFTDIVPLSGHGAHQKPLHLSAPKIEAHLQNELSSLCERLSDTPKSAFALSRTVREMRPRIFPQWLAVSQTLAYLTHLTLTGRARCMEAEEGFLYCRS